ncbi:MAG: hypothetical protein K5695_17415 [Oscillospiraceae bacterium]|nr:hypothetical protein [Oscillospiraceae bacterium]
MDTSYFPIRIELHIVLALLAFLVFGLQFIRYHKSHHLILAIALPCTLLPYLFDSKAVFYAIGIGELVALALALVLSQTLDKDKEPVKEIQEKQTPEDEA